VALGLEQAIAELLAAPPGTFPPGSFGGLYDDATPANRVIFVGEQPEIRPEDADPLPDLTITVFPDGGDAPRLTLEETWSITIHTRHPSYQTAMSTARDISDLLNQNGGAGLNRYAQSPIGTTGGGIRVTLISADFPVTRLGRDTDGSDGRFIAMQTFTVKTPRFSFI